ncbi:acyltransferase family protein [Microbulbifer sp. 2304DJ12-6]|uniref:acyltransferase family protein n=1 Tax=Microbulbifer sp. 2304DJ12-6 TaxID=3233340 RepID=UPI0039B005E7
MINKRRYELDWLRVIAFGVLIYFHAAIFFVPFGQPLIQNEETSTMLEHFIHVSSQFRLALLFFISGVGVYFARRKLNERAFVEERSRRLLIPLGVGLLFVVPPMVYIEKVFLSKFEGSLLDFYPLVFTTGVYPEGNLSWHHFWFIAYLYLFCLLAIAPFRWLANLDESRRDWFLSRFAGLGLYWLIPFLFVPEVLLRWLFPGFRDLIHDWASFTLWFIVFLAGYCIANRVSLIDDAIRVRQLSLLLAVISTLSMYGLFEEPGPDLSTFENSMVGYVLWCGLRMTMVWCAILTCLGYAGKYLQFSNGLLNYLSEAVYPLFILHLTTLVAFGYFIVRFDWSVGMKYLALSTSTIVFILCVYQVGIKPFDSMRLLFGMKPIAAPVDGI